MAVNLSPVGGVAAQFFTNTGAVLTGGKLYTYLAGTTTPAATYTTSAGNVAHTNPIVLDAAGRVSSGGEIWLTIGTTYKFQLKDSNDVLIGTYDNVPSAFNTDAALVSYTPAGANAVVTTVQAKLRENVSVKDFGAVGDGVTDDTTAFQNALAYLSGGGELFIPSGTYVYTTTLNMSIVGLTVRGCGKTSRLQFNGTGNCIEITQPDLASVKTAVTLDNFWVSGNANATNGIFINYWTNWTLTDMHVGNVTGAGFYIGFTVFGYMKNPTVYDYDWGVSGFTVKPTNGLLLGRTAGGVITAPDHCASTIINPNIQGVSGSGIKGVNGFNNTFVGGSSENNTGFTLELLSDFVQNSFNGINLEGGDTSIAGSQNNFIGVILPSSGNDMLFTSTASSNKVLGGTVGTMTFAAGSTRNGVELTTITANLGLTDSGTDNTFEQITVNNVFYTKLSGIINGSSFLSQGGAVSTTTAVPATLFTSSFGSYLVTAYIANFGTAGHASAIVINDNTTTGIANTAFGGQISLTISGANVQVTQTSGGTQTVIYSVIKMPAS
jgi:Pectate lyase superfamily protein